MAETSKSGYTAASAWIVVACALLAAMSCSLPIDRGLQPPTAIELASPVPSLAPPSTPLSDPTPSETPREPQVPRPTLEALLPLDVIPVGSGLQLERIHMLTSSAGWAIGGVPGSARRVLRTNDGGQTWRDVSPSVPASRKSVALELVADFVDLERAWIVRYLPLTASGLPSPTPELLVVWRTSDGGASWEPSQPLELEFIAGGGGKPYLVIEPEIGGWLLARAGGAGMHQYPVSLVRASAEDWQWELIHDPFTEQGSGLMGCHKSGMTFNNAGVGILTIDSCPVTGPEIRRTFDGGETWEIVTPPLPQGEAIEEEGGLCEPHSPAFLESEELVIAVQCRVFHEETQVSNFLYRSMDNGDSWQIDEYPGGSPIFMTERVTWALSREIWRSLDAGDQWELRKTVFWDGQFSFLSEDLGWAVASEGEEVALVRSKDGGETWALLDPVIAP